MTTTFYSAIPEMDRITQITEPDYYYDVPADWHIAVTDVKNSTGAIENGRYKDVNAVAAASITGILNQAGRLDIPFAFGGDGASVLIPAEMVEGARKVLLATKQLAWHQFDLELRVGIVPVRAVLLDGYRIRIGRLRMSENFQQAIFSGGGLAYAERLLKEQPAYQIEDTSATTYEADFSGFECRWNEIPSPYDETVSLMTSATKGTSSAQNAIYGEVLAQVETIYGDSVTRRPISVHNMRMALSANGMQTEAKVKYQDTSASRIGPMLRGSIMAAIAMRFNIQGWGKYKQLVVGSIDNEKFDDTLRMTISGKVAQRERLTTYLEGRYQAGELVYGIHIAQHALMTCVIFDYFGRQVHFIDGSGGGYALAARDMKAQLKTQKG